MLLTMSYTEFDQNLMSNKWQHNVNIFYRFMYKKEKNQGYWDSTIYSISCAYVIWFIQYYNLKR